MCAQPPSSPSLSGQFLHQLPRPFLEMGWPGLICFFRDRLSPGLHMCPGFLETVSTPLSKLGRSSSCALVPTNPAKKDTALPDYPECVICSWQWRLPLPCPHIELQFLTSQKQTQLTAVLPACLQFLPLLKQCILIALPYSIV